MKTIERKVSNLILKGRHIEYKTPFCMQPHLFLIRDLSKLILEHKNFYQNQLKTLLKFIKSAKSPQNLLSSHPVICMLSKTKIVVYT